MAAAPISPLVTVEEYLGATYEPECEYVDGVLLKKPMGKRSHSLLQFYLLMHLGDLRESRGLVICPELRIQVAPRRYRVPDVCVFTQPIQEDTPTIAPALTIEIVSDTETFSSLLAKARHHHRMGVRTVILADPYEKTVSIVGEDGLLRQIGEPQIVSLELQRGTLSIDFDQLFEQVESLA